MGTVARSLDRKVAMLRRPTLLVVVLAAGCSSAEPEEAMPEDEETQEPAGSDRRDAGRTGDARTPSPAADKLDAGPRRTDAGAGSDAGRTLVDARASDASDARTASGTDAQGAIARDAMSPVPAEGQGCGAGAFCADFEDQTGGQLSGEWSAVSPTCTGNGMSAIDDTIAHAGKRSVRLSSPGGTCHHIFAKPRLDLAAFGSELWVRMFARFDKPLGAEHVTFFAMHDRVSGKDLRMGGQSGILMWNREVGDATLPELSPNGIAKSVPIAAGVWKCIEFHLSGSAGKLETFVDDQLVEALVVDGTPTMDVDGQWLRGATAGSWMADVEDLRFGWESYGGPPNTVWYDDIVVGAERAGCK
jgi:hypothetical protein